MTTQSLYPGSPWSLHIDRDGTEDFAIIASNGEDLVRSEFFWQPEEDEQRLPKYLAAIWLMFHAPKLLQALKALAEEANASCPANSRSSYFIEALEQANAVVAEATSRPPYISRHSNGIPLVLPPAPGGDRRQS